MPKIRRLSGTEIIKILAKFCFLRHSKKGSHVKLRRKNLDRKETLIVPLHQELDTGTCQAIFKQATAYIPESELYSYFYE
ncbi:MAG: type II toxin-antitoxin system HicA family toxin [Hormoscilla sp. GM102CHS1]|nr:type II toxin-antitoxin system HicA family toxin [Hormoscilla sp. GM102CHS1]